MKRSKGQSFVEYSLSGILVLSTCIGALTLLGNHLNLSFSSMVPSSRQAAAASTPIPSPPPIKASASVPTSISPSANLARPITRQTLPKTAADLIVTAGANGVSETTLAFAELITQSAQTYQQSDPEVYNAIVKLGLQGQELARTMKTCEADACDLNALEHEIGAFHDIYMNDIYYVDLEKQMTAEDFKLIANLTNQSEALAEDLQAIKSDTYNPNAYHPYVSGSDGDITDYPVGQSLIGSSATVNTNSFTTEQCGRNLACKQ